MIWNVGYKHVEYLCKFGLKNYVISLGVVVVTALLSVMLIILGKGKEKERQ